MAAYEENVRKISGIAGADLSALANTFVTINSSGKIVAATTKAYALGILAVPGKIGENVTIVTEGIYPVKIKGALATGAQVEVGVGAAASTFSDGKVMGTCMLGGAADGDFASVYLHK